MDLEQAVNEFIEAKEIENLSDKTIESYKSMTNELVKFLGNISLRDYSASSVRTFIKYQQNREGRLGKLSDATIHKYYSVIRTFSRWLREQEYQEYSATEKVRAPRVEKKLPECLTDEELHKLLTYLKVFCSPRVNVLFYFFLDTGARLSEVVGLNVTDLHLDDGWVKVYGKGRRERILPLGGTLRSSMSFYIEEIRPAIANEDEEALFVTKLGSRYTKEGLSTLVKSKLKKVGVAGHYGPHKLRHTFATKYLRNGGQLEQLRLVLGHRDISTTQRYLSLTTDDLFKAQQTASPMDNLNERLVIN
ncbi:MAG: tyrosine-type recombinase/integrase [Candidatus Helarchaeota archaeon]